MLKRARVVAVRERAKRLLERSVGKRERSMTVETRCVFVPVMPWIHRVSAAPPGARVARRLTN
jgi:hypothetical protein